MKASNEVLASAVTAIEALILDPTKSSTPHCVEEYNAGVQNALDTIRSLPTDAD